MAPIPLNDLAAVTTLTSRLSVGPFSEAATAALDLLVDVTGADASELFLAEPDKAAMVLAGHRGSFRHAFFQILRFQSGEGYPGLELVKPVPILSERLATDPQYLRSRVKEHGFNAYVSLPLSSSSSGVSGSLGVAFRRPDPDLQRALNLMSWLGSPLSMALEDHLLRLRDAVRVTVRQQAHDAQKDQIRETLSHILSLMMAGGGAQGGVLSLIDDRNGGRVLRHVEEGIAPRSYCGVLRDNLTLCPALRERRGRVLYGKPEERSTTCRANPHVGAFACCIPLSYSDKVAGLCQLYYQHLGISPPTSNLAFLEAIADDAGQIILEVTEQEERERRAQSVFAAFSAADGRSTSLSALTDRPNAQVPAEGLEIRCFGTFEVYRHGLPITPEMVHRRKTITLLKILLAHHARPLAKDILIETLWPDSDPETKTGQLYVLVHELRQLLSGGGGLDRSLVRNEGDRYYFAKSGSCSVDVAEFSSLVDLGNKAETRNEAETAAACYEAAVQLYRGDFMEDEPFAEWCEQERERLRECCLDVLQRLARLSANSDSWNDSVKWLRKALRIDPLRENVHRDLMYYLWAGGHRDEAVRQYQTCLDLLRRELEVDPLPETQQLYHRLLSKPKP